MPNKDKDGVWHPKQEVSYQDAFDLYRFWRIGTFRGDLLGKCEKNMKKWVDLLAQEVDLFHFSSEWARHSLNESDLTTTLISLEEADFHGASSLSDFASQAEAKDNVEFEQSEKLTFVRPSSTAQAEAEDSDESIDSMMSLRPRRWSMRVWKRKHECMLENMSV